MLALAVCARNASPLMLALTVCARSASSSTHAFDF